MKKERWVVSAKRADFQAIADRFGIDPVIARLIRNRDVTGEKAIDVYKRQYGIRCFWCRTCQYD